MFAVRLSRIPLTAFVTTFTKPPAILKPGQCIAYVRQQTFASEVRSGLSRAKKRKSLKEMAMAPAGDGGT